LSEADVRRAIEQPLASGASAAAGTSADTRAAVVMGRRGAVAAKTAGQAAYLKELADKDLVFALGPAGSGKTFLAVAYGVSLLLKGRVDRLVITRPAVEAGERLGFLPGDLNEKIDPYLTPIWGALEDIIGAEALKKRRERNEIEVAPLAYMRGRTLNYACVIIDEAQNTTRMQMKMILTRLGEGSKMVVTGDPSQIDLPNRNDSGLTHAVGLLGKVKGVGVAELTSEDIVRHELVARIVRAYDNEHRNAFGGDG
jgi:phosphate starvation-inducible PhoH-like protein